MSYQRIMTEQKSRLVKILEEKYNSNQGASNANGTNRRSEWERIKKELNTMGIKKTEAEWRKCWLNMKSRAKGKYAAILTSRGDPNQVVPLTKIDKEILAIISKESGYVFTIPVASSSKCDKNPRTEEVNGDANNIRCMDDNLQMLNEDSNDSDSDANNMSSEEMVSPIGSNQSKDDLRMLIDDAIISDSIFEFVSPILPASSEAVDPPSASSCTRPQKKSGESPANLDEDVLFSKAMNMLKTPVDSNQIFVDYVADQMRSLADAKQKQLKLMIVKAIVAVQED